MEQSNFKLSLLQFNLDLEKFKGKDLLGEQIQERLNKSASEYEKALNLAYAKIRDLRLQDAINKITK